MPYFCQYPSSVDVNCFDSTLKELVFFSTAIFKEISSLDTIVVFAVVVVYVIPVAVGARLRFKSEFIETELYWKSLTSDIPAFYCGNEPEAITGITFITKVLHLEGA